MRSTWPRVFVQGLAVVAVAVPAMGIALLVFREGAAEFGDMPLNRVFHLTLGAALMLLFADLVVTIRRSGSAGAAFAIGAVGFVVCLVGAVLSEMLGPPAVALLVLVGASWAGCLLRAGSGGRAEQPHRRDAAS
jgi:hypothetical protein